MNILFVIENYLPHIGGVEVVFRNLAEGLAQRGHSVTIITHRMRNTLKEETINGVRIKRVDCFASRYLFTFFAIPLAVREAKNADIVHTTTFNGFFPAWLAAKFNGKPIVATIHEVWIGKWRKFSNFGWLNSWLHDLGERLLIYSLPKVDRYIAVSHSTLQQLYEIGKTNVTVIYNGVDYKHFNPEKANGEIIRRKYGFNRDYVLLVYGRPGPSKGIEYAVRAMKEIGIKIPNAKMMLILSRDKQYEKSLKKISELIQRLNLEDKIISIPPVRHSELPNYIKAADCVVVPSLSEGFGFTAAETAAMGKPIVASDTTSLPEVVSGKYLLVQPRNSSGIANAVYAIKHGKAKNLPLRKFTTEENIAKYLEVYKLILDKKV
jgi:D-inositol-3-phosphate glycosyltransferase